MHGRRSYPLSEASDSKQTAIKRKFYYFCTMQKIVRCNEHDYTTLAGIWKRSVVATHTFLTEEAINEIESALIPDYFPYVDLYAVVDNDITAGFIGLNSDRIEMLFVDSDRLGRGYGVSPIAFARRNGATKVDVNEQNPNALGFYLANGFEVTGRDDTDEAGRPYPILHMSL